MPPNSTTEFQAGPCSPYRPVPTKKEIKTGHKHRISNQMDHAPARSSPIFLSNRGIATVPSKPVITQSP